MRGRGALLLLAALPLSTVPARAQPPDPGILYAAAAADSILATGGAGVGLEAFAGDSVTGVYLKGAFRGETESVAYGVDPEGKRYVWFSVARGDSLEHVAMLFDVDLDLVPDFLLFRTIDRSERLEELTEYRATEIMEAEIEIQVQPACVPPRCDPTTWTVRPREVIETAPPFFDPWRSVFALAATRGEAWLGEPKSIFAPERVDAPRP